MTKERENERERVGP